MTTRRQFTQALAGTAFAGLLGACTGPAIRAGEATAGARPRAYGELLADPAGLLDLPAGFSYSVISAYGGSMDDGLQVPDYADGMGCFASEPNQVVLVRNHELQAQQQSRGALRGGTGAKPPTYDRNRRGEPLPGGTTTLIYDLVSRRVVRQHLSLLGTIRNCAGGITPWGSWLSCEENLTRAGNGVERDHGWVFEVPASARSAIEPVPLTALGRFNHEAAAVDPRTGIVYLTEDQPDGLLYRLLPTARGELARGGRLQALALAEPGLDDTRNWLPGRKLTRGDWVNTRWINLDRVESPDDDLRGRGHDRGAALFARGEGIHMGDGELYFCCTSGGAAKLGQVLRYRLSPFEGRADERRQPGRLQVFVESDDLTRYNYGDNLTVAPNGHLIVCEDQYTAQVDNHLRGITPAGELYDFARLRAQTELAGACFSPDGSTLFVNAYSPTQTFAITGPWAGFVG